MDVSEGQNMAFVEGPSKKVSKLREVKHHAGRHTPKSGRCGILSSVVKRRELT